MPVDPTGRYKGNNFDPNYAAKRKAKQEQQQQQQHQGQYQGQNQYQQRYKKNEYDQRPRDNGYSSRSERDGRGWQGPASLDYGDGGSNTYQNQYTPRSDTYRDNFADRSYEAIKEYRPHNTYYTSRYAGTPRDQSPTATTSRPSAVGARISTPPPASAPSNQRGGDAPSKKQNNAGAPAPSMALSASGAAVNRAPAGTTDSPGGELSSLEKLKLFKAQVEASRAARSTDASSTAVTQVAESFLQRESTGQKNGTEEGEVTETAPTPTNDKAQALKAKLKALKQQKGKAGAGAANKEKGTPSNTKEIQANGGSARADKDKGPSSASVATPTPASAQPPSKAASTAKSSQQTRIEPGNRASDRPVQSYADAARDYTRRRSASPRGRASSPVRFASRTREPYERRNNASDDRYADQPPEYSRPRARQDDTAGYDRPTFARQVHTPRPTHASSPAPVALPVSSTSINLVVKTLEVIKAQVEQLEVLIQPMLEGQVAGETPQIASSQPRATPQSFPRDMPPPSVPAYAEERRSTYGSNDQGPHSSYVKRRQNYDDDDSSSFYRGTPTRGGFKKARGGGRGGKAYYEGREGYKDYYKD